MIEERFARIVPIASVAVALLTGGAWLASVHAGPGYQPPPFQQQPPFQQAPPPFQPQPPPPEPPPKSTGCAGCDCSDCDVSGCDCSGCDVSDCDLSGCDVSGCDVSCALPMTHVRMLRGTSWLALLLPLALLDAWRRRVKDQNVYG